MQVPDLKTVFGMVDCLISEELVKPKTPCMRTSNGSLSWMILSSQRSIGL